ncbi:MAG: hypothetical protein ACP5RJ_07015 [Conexivisphaera sp.]
MRLVGFTTYPPLIYAGDTAGELEVILVNYGDAAAEDVNSTATLNISYTAGSGEMDIPIEIAPSAHFVYTRVVHGSTASGASNSYVTVTLLNAGGAEAKYATVTLLTSPIFSPYAPSSENPIIAAESINYSLGNVAPGSAVNVTYLVDIASGLKARHLLSAAPRHVVPAAHHAADASGDRGAHLGRRAVLPHVTLVAPRQ